MKYIFSFATLTLLVALSLSTIAAYYSVIGLAAIFAAATIPIYIMGGTLELAKVVTAAWLHNYWDRAPWNLKSYLIIAVAGLMFLTSLGIFGFLSKAHIEQTALSDEQVAVVESLDGKISRSQAKIDRWETELSRLFKGEDVRVDNLVANEQTALDRIYDRIKEEKDTLRESANSQIEQQNIRLQQAADRKEADIAAAQKILDSTSFGGQDAFDEAVSTAKSNELSVASSAQREIRTINSRLSNDLNAIDEKYADQIKAYEDRIADLRSQATVKTEDIDARVEELEAQIEAEQIVIDDAREEKFVNEKAYRQLEAEVGPVKYIAEFVYGESADQNMLERAVQWVIILIIFVFDPLAITLVLASQSGYRWIKEDSNEKVESQTSNPSNNVGNSNPSANDDSIDDNSNDIDSNLNGNTERIVEVEKIVEVPVERIVEKIVEVEKPEEDIDLTPSPAIQELERRLAEKLDGNSKTD